MMSFASDRDFNGTLMGCSYFLVVSNLEKIWKMLEKRPFFRVDIRPNWKNTSRADMAGLWSSIFLLVTRVYGDFMQSKPIRYSKNKSPLQILGYGIAINRLQVGKLYIRSLSCK